MPPQPVLARPAPPDAWPAPDAAQAQVLAHRGRALLVRGAAGSGRTTTALRLVHDRVASGELEPDDVLLLAPTRQAAAALRDELSRHLRATAGRPLVRTPSSLAFSVLRARAALLGTAPPALISGPEQDLVLGDLLAGHAAGEGARVEWPASVPPEALALRAFRDELRDLLMRASERGLGPTDLARLGRRHGRPEWVAAARVMAEYLAVTRLRGSTPDVGGRYDPAVIVDEAAEALAAWDQELPGQARPRWRLVVVDDHQESTAATVRLLHTLADDGASLVLLADPDSAVQTFRGATPMLVDRATEATGRSGGAGGPAPAGRLGAFGADEVVLPTVWRHGPALRSRVTAVTGEIRGPGRAHRAAVAGTDRPGDVRVALLRSPAEEAAYVARTLRAAHLAGLAWSRMAVVVRAGGQVGDLRRALLGAQVPVEVTRDDLPLRAEPAVRPLLVALECVLDPAAVDADHAALLLSSSLGGTDAVGLRRLRRTLRAEERAAGGERTSEELLPELLADPRRAEQLPTSVRRGPLRVARVLAAGRQAVADRASVPEILWALWSAAGLAEPWRRLALAGGPAGDRADRDLDAVLALLTAAEQFADRLPHAGAEAFLEHLRAQDLPADTLAAQGRTPEAVDLVTAAAAAGREWDLVVVAGVQDGVWPDLRLRDSLLGAQHLVDVLDGRVATSGTGKGLTKSAAGWALAEARAAVLDDELRSFAVAVSRSRDRLVVTAVSDGEHEPSPFVDLVEPSDDEGADHRLVQAAAPLDLRAVVARCRADLETAEDPAWHPAARLLARLVAEGVPGADPDQWYGARALSSTEPLWDPDATVPLSPSTLESAARCPLRWALEGAGGRAADTGEQSLGTLLHAVAADLPTGTKEELTTLLDDRWAELGLRDGWVDATQRRRAAGMVAHLAQYLRRSGEPVAVEQPFEARVGQVLLRGVVDRLERVVDEDGVARLRVVDLKTGRSPVSAADAERHPQLGAYQAAVRAGAFDDVAAAAGVAPGAPSAGAALVYVGTANRRVTERAQVPPEVADDPGWVDQMLAEVAGTVTQVAMTASENDLCRVCPVRRSCPVQVEGAVVGAVPAPEGEA